MQLIFDIWGAIRRFKSEAKPKFERVDPTLGLHSMGGYSNPSKPMDFIKSGIQAAVVGKSLGII